ncbi:hypothetical protein [Candidatus Albibeggiatoa sp. nov. BB20]|uniref:hypothetical protein n=1 Tax=Candidatus Albibeggiatoa sp. nov. BB20 TaxID=3162723 RepID=UPI003365AC7D
MILRAIIPAIVAISWLILLKPLMIIDVWDESNFLVYFYSQSNSLWDKLVVIWTQPLGNLYRPIPVSIASIILDQTTFSPFAWQILRAVNVVLLLSCLTFILHVFQRWKVKAYLFPVFTLLFLFSSSGLITATWYANIFDVSSLFLLSLALLLISYQAFFWVGIAVGLSFFCKEINLIFLPFLVILYLNHKIDLKSLLKLFSMIIIVGGSYWILRFNMIDLGSDGDIHDFAVSKFWPSLVGFVDSFWWQNMHRTQAGWLGITCFGLSIIAFRTYLNRLLFTGLLFLTLFIYWGMFAYYQHDVINHLNFIGRLYLIPATLLLISLALWARPIVFGLIAIPLLFGGWQTYQAHQQFQETFLEIVQLAEKQEQVLVIDFKDNPLQNDIFRQIQFGAHPQAKYKIDLKTGTLIENKQ